MRRRLDVIYTEPVWVMWSLWFGFYEKVRGKDQRDGNCSELKSKGFLRGGFFVQICIVFGTGWFF